MNSAENPSEKLLLHGGAVLPCDGRSTAQEALLLENGRIRALGGLDDLTSLAGRDAARVDLGGATVLPGLVDTHPHAMHFASFGIAMVDLSDARNHEDIISRIAAQAENTSPGQWIMCTPVGEAHYFHRRSYRDLAEGRLPDRHTLDRASSEHPVMIQAWAPVIPNVAAFNSMGLQQVGLAWHTPRRVCDVWIDRDSRGELTGIVRGSVTNYYTHDPFWMQIWDRLPLPPEEIWVHGGCAGMEEMNANGVTTIYEGHVMEPEHVRAYQQLNSEDRMRCRVLTSLEAADMAFHPHYRPTPEELEARLQLALSLMDTKGEYLRHNGITVARSGPCGPGFINLYEPFKNPYGELVYGYAFLPRWVEEQCIDFCMEHGLRMNILAASPRDHDDFFESVKKHDKAEIRRQEWILQHAILINDHDAARYADYGLHVTTCKGFHWGKGDYYAERIGRHTWKDLIPLECGVEDLPGTKVLRTLLSGNTVFDSGAL